MPERSRPRLKIHAIAMQYRGAIPNLDGKYSCESGKSAKINLKFFWHKKICILHWVFAVVSPIMSWFGGAVPW